MTLPGPAAAMLAFLQERIQQINAVRAPPVMGFLVGRETARALGAVPRSEEELWVVEGRETLDVGLFLDDRVLADLAAASPSRHGRRLLARARIEGVTSAAEGISHFVYLATRAGQDRPVSLLELEAQAELDKFALFAIQAWRAGPRRWRRASAALRSRLFERVHYHAHLSDAEVARYRTANRLAAGYARWLERRFLSRGDREGMIGELRATYRRGGVEKLGYLGSRGWAG
jgi:hypothetical protein